MTTPGRRRPARTIAAAALIVVGAIVAPVAVLAQWTRSELTSTDRFVETFAPLAEDAGVQNLLIDRVSGAINSHLDVVAATDELAQAAAKAGVPAAVTAKLQGVLTASVHGLVEQTTGRVIRSPQFAATFRTALRVSHAQIIATLQRSPDALVSVQSDGEIGIRLGPIVTAVRAALVSQGLGIARAIPDVTTTVVIAHAEQLPLAQRAYAAAVAIGSWAPWIALLLLIGGVLIAVRRVVALAWAAAGLGFTMLVVLLGLAIVRAAVIPGAVRSLIPTSVADTVFDEVTLSIRETLVVVAVVAIAVLVVALVLGPTAIAGRLRAATAEGFAAARAALDRHGLSTGLLGRGLDRARLPIRIAIAVLAALGIVLIRPLTVGLVAWIGVLALVLLALLELLRRTNRESFAGSTATEREADAL